MKRIKKNSEIKVGDTIIIEENYSRRCYFKTKKTTLVIASFDGIHFWSLTKNKKLTESWQGYEELCIGSPEKNNFKFYKK